MYLSKIKVSNFRNFKQLEASFYEGLNVIVGENNIGKTNLLDAIRIALGPSTTVGNGFIPLSKDDLHRDPNNTNNSFNIELEFAGMSDKEQGEFLDILDYNATSPENSVARIYFSWTWDEQRKRGIPRRTSNGNTAIPEDILQGIQYTYLDALRNAVEALSPNRRSKLGRLIQVLISGDDDKKNIENILKEANTKLKENKKLGDVTSEIQTALTGVSGKYFSQEVDIQTSEIDFDRITNSLRLVLKEFPNANDNLELWTNGLGYNNLLYIAVVLAELQSENGATLPILLAEEPEAHLHPQLKTVLADFLGKQSNKVQTIVTTHSPVIASRVLPSKLCILHKNTSADSVYTLFSLRKCGLTEKEERKLQRMLDITRATMLFARGIILVEGICEALLLPKLAQLMGISLEEKGISVVPICGVDFNTFVKLLSQKNIYIPTAIITDGDPKVKNKDKVENAIPTRIADGTIEKCDRLNNLETLLNNNELCKVFSSKVTLEYDLAEAGVNNPEVMVSAWENAHTGTTRSLTSKNISTLTTLEDKTLKIWREICLRDSTSISKAEFAHELADKLNDFINIGAQGDFCVPTYIFSSPKYIKQAIEHVVGSPDAKQTDTTK